MMQKSADCVICVPEIINTTDIPTVAMITSYNTPMADNGACSPYITAKSMHSNRWYQHVAFANINLRL